MKIIPPLLQLNYGGRVVHRAFCIRVTRGDGQVLRFTSSQIPVLVGSENYLPGLGLTMSQIGAALGLAVNEVQVKGPIAGVLASSDVTDDDLLAGKWDGAKYICFSTNPRAPGNGIEEGLSGSFGRITAGRVAFEVELRDLMQRYQSPIGEVSTPGCRVKKLGDARCKVILTPYTFAAVVTALTSRSVFGASALTQGDDYFRFGELVWTTGLNAGVKGEVKIFVAGGVIGLQIPMPHNILPGDAFTIVAGCDRSLAACRDKFNNVPRFVGEPHKPTGDQVTRGPK